MNTIHSTRPLKEKQRQEREILILQVAEAVLMEKGYYDTSIDEIAARVGIAKGTVYLHFSSKEDLVAAIYMRDMQRFWQEVEAEIDPMATPRTRLEKLLFCMYGGLFCKRARLFYNVYNSAELQHLFTTKKAVMQEIWGKISTMVAALLDEGKAAGEFDTTIPTSIMQATFFSLLSPRSYQRLVVEEQMPTEELVRQLGRVYFKGIAAQIPGGMEDA